MSSPAVVTQSTSVDAANGVHNESNNEKPMRALAAPSFESEDGGDIFDVQPRLIDQSHVGPTNISGEGRVDHTNFAFPALEPYDKLTLAKVSTAAFRARCGFNMKSNVLCFESSIVVQRRRAIGSFLARCWLVPILPP